MILHMCLHRYLHMYLHMYLHRFGFKFGFKLYCNSLYPKWNNGNVQNRYAHADTTMNESDSLYLNRNNGIQVRYA